MSELVQYAEIDVDITRDLLDELLPRVSRPRVELRLMDECVRMFTERGFALDPDEAAELRQKVEERVEQACEAVGADEESISADTSFMELLGDALEETDREVPTKKNKNGKDILAFSKQDEARRRLLKDDDPQVRALAEARVMVQSAPSHRNRIARFENIAEATGGRLPVPLTYHSAHTGRYGGGGGINLQNLPKRTGGPAEEISGLLKAAPGRALVGADASQIEARILANLAGEEELVESFRSGVDVYSEFASGVFGEEVRKPTGEDPPKKAKRLKALRHIGKTAILGLGYGMGWKRFKGRLEQSDLSRPLLEGGQLDDASIKDIVYEQYRRGYPAIPRFWDRLEEGFRDALLHGQGEGGGIEFEKDGDDVIAHLPSGRCLRYRDAHSTVEGDITYDGGSKKIYGGKLAENVVQALARDFICESMLRAEEEGYNVLLQIHDEIVLDVPERDAEEAHRFLMEVLCTPPQWMSGLPVDAEAWVGGRYGVEK